MCPGDFHSRRCSAPRYLSLCDCFFSRSKIRKLVYQLVFLFSIFGYDLNNLESENWICLSHFEMYELVTIWRLNDVRGSPGYLTRVLRLKGCQVLLNMIKYKGFKI